MANENIENTAPVPVQPLPPPLETVENEHETPAPKKIKRGRWVLFGILGILLLAAIGASIGYGMAIKARMAAATEQKYVQATVQYELAMQDQKDGKLDMARQRLEYVIQIYPEFPLAVEKLTEVMMAIGQSGTQIAATSAPVITPEATKDTRAAAELYADVQTQFANSQWTELLTTIRSIRDSDPTYEAVKLDGFYYLALRNDGIVKIQNGDLEMGLYEFALADQMAPIDTDAESYRTWARLYLTGASYWNIDWEQVTTYFSQLYAMVPNLMDSSSMTVTMRYGKGLELWGDAFAASGDFCSAVPKYEASAGITWSQPLVDKIDQANQGCAGQPPTPEGGVAPTPVPSETIPVPETPTDTSVPTDVPVP